MAGRNRVGMERSYKYQDAEIVLQQIRFHENLTKLVITSYYARGFPLSWLKDSGLKLKSIHLRGCRECPFLPLLGHLQLLESLLIEDMPALQEVFGENFKGFPSLKSLEFRNMLELKEWEGLKVGYMPALRVLICKNCPRLQSLPSLDVLSSLTILKIKGCPTLKSLPERMPISLQELDVRGSTIVEDRCEEGGEDWLKTRAIPALKIVTSRSLMNELPPAEL